MDEKTKRYMTYAGIAVIGVFVVFIWPHKYEWDGDGTINAFPSNDSVKNYRLDATMDVTSYSRGWIHSHNEYTISGARWPNGGEMRLSNCIVREKSQTKCTDQDGNAYGIEVESFPDPPEGSSEGSDY